MKVLNCQLRLDRLRQEERAVIVVMLQMMNEISILRKHLIFAGNGSENPKGAQRTAQRVVSLFLLRELAGKLYEGWEVLRKGYYGRRLSYFYEGRGGHLSAKGKQARGKIDAYFKATDCLIKRIRDKHTSHYDIEAVEEGMKSHGPANPCPMLLAEEAGNCVYVFAEDIVTDAILQRLSPNSRSEAMGKMLDEVLAVSGWFQDFVLKLALLLPIEYDSEEDLTDVDCLNAVGLPFFVRPPNMPASAPES